MCPIQQAYEVIHGALPPDLPLWQIARAVVEGFDGSKLSEALGRDALEHVIAYVLFPTEPMTKEVVGRAENLLPEICSDYDPSEEVHMDLVAWRMGRRFL